MICLTEGNNSYCVVRCSTPVPTQRKLAGQAACSDAPC